MTDEADRIRNMSPMEHIRLKPGMYFGGTEIKSMHLLVYVLVGHSINQAIVGKASRVAVILSDNHTVTVTDDGPGMSTAESNDTDKTILETVLSTVGERSLNGETLHFRYYASGVGLAGVNAVSDMFEIVVKSDGYLWQQTYQKGAKQTELMRVGPLKAGESTGTAITFRPDFEVFDRNKFDFRMLAHRLRELAYLVRGFHISLEDRRSSSHYALLSFHYPDGIADYVRHLNRDYQPVHEPLSITRMVDLKIDNKATGQRAMVEVVFQYTDQPQTLILGYINGLEIIGGGVHLDALIDALDKALYRFANDQGIFEKHAWHVIEYDVIYGLTAVINLWHPNPGFEGNMRYKVIGPDVKDAVYDVVRDMMNAAVNRENAAVRRIAQRVLRTQAQREQRRLLS